MSRDLRLLALVGLALSILAPYAHAAPAKPAKPPAGPRVVTTEPAYGSKTVDPGLAQLTITFNEPMQPGKFYLGPIAGRELPDWGEPVALSQDGLVLTVPITLKPGRKYGIAVNAPGHLQFRSVAGKPARPYQLFFNTADKPVGEAAAAAGGAAVAPAGPAPAGFRIVAPTDGSEVRDKVVVTVPAESVPEGGFVTFFVNGTFVVGMAPEKRTGLLKFVWDTKRPLPGVGTADSRVPKDGAHTIRTELHEGSRNEPTQASEVKVNLKNTINTPEAAEGFQLRYQFATGQDLAYHHEFESRVKRGGDPAKRHRGEILSRVMLEEKLVEGPFALWGKFSRARVDDVKLTGSDLSAKWGLPKSVRFELDQQGIMRIVSKKGRPLVEVFSQFLPLPPNRVKLNESWESTLVLPEVLKEKTALVPAKHVIDSVVWEGGQECVVIKSDYQVPSFKDPEPSKHTILATGAADVPAGSTLQLRGRRYTYFAYKIGRVMRVTEQKNLVLTLASAAGGMPGMGGPGGGGMPGMPGGGGMPGMGGGPMGPGMPGMGQGGMGGGPGMGGPGGGMMGGMGGAGGAGGGTAQKVTYNIEAREELEYLPPGEAEE